MWETSFLLSPHPQCLDDDLLQINGREKERELRVEKGVKESISSTCLNVKLLQEASDGLWRHKGDGQFHQVSLGRELIF